MELGGDVDMVDVDVDGATGSVGYAKEEKDFKNRGAMSDLRTPGAKVPLESGEEGDLCKKGSCGGLTIRLEWGRVSRTQPWLTQSRRAGLERRCGVRLKRPSYMSCVDRRGSEIEKERGGGGIG
jgi:hypothetical protein